MSNCIMAYPNYPDSTYYRAVLSGGNWVLPLTNMLDPLLTHIARSADASTSSAFFDVDLTVLRDIRLLAIPAHNIQRQGQVRVRGTIIPAFAGATVNANASAGDSSISMKANTGAITVTEGDAFTISGDATVYKVTNTVTIENGGNATVNIEPVLTVNATATTLITCHTGDYTTTVVDTDFEDVWKILYPWGSIPLEHPSFFDGKITEEKAQNYPLPYLKVLDNTALARYWRFEVRDPSNSDGYIDLARLFMSPGWQPTINMSYGAQVHWTSETGIFPAENGAIFYKVRPRRRVARFEISYLSINEMLANGMDMQQELDVSKQMFFVMDPSDTINLHRTSFLATMTELSPIEWPIFNVTSKAFQLQEVVA